MVLADEHADRDYIAARQEEYVDAWRSGSADRIMSFMDGKDFSYSNFGVDKEGLSHSHLKELVARNNTDYHEMNNGDKTFTAWEWVIKSRAAVGADGRRLKKEEAPLKKVVGCSHMWWNKDDKIVRNHEYQLLRDAK